VTVGVWVGNFDRKPLRNSSGVTGAAPIFNAVMQAAEKRFGASDPLADVALKPDTLQQQSICELSGLRATPACPKTELEWIESSSTLRSCNWHVMSQRMTSSGVTTTARVEWPLEYRSWAEGRGLIAPPSIEATPRPAVRTASNRIVSPPDGAVYLIDPTLRSSFQTAKLKANVAGSPRRVEWRVDGSVVASAMSTSEVRWPLRSGRHRVELRDGSRSHAVEITVK
jgi:penicillin-binding protein 1C